MGSSIGTEVLDRLFAPHGASAYFRRLRGTPGGARPADEPVTATMPATPGTATTPAALATATTPATTATKSAAATATVTPTKTTASPMVTFAASGTEAPADGSLLETAEAAGLTPRFRCRRGICGTCTTSKLSGAVEDLRTGEMSDAAEPIRICVSEARSDVCLDL